MLFILLCAAQFLNELTVQMCLVYHEFEVYASYMDRPFVLPSLSIHFPYLHAHRLMSIGLIACIRASELRKKR